jgi:imidazolonepropionase-like amidohydrolase
MPGSGLHEEMRLLTVIGLTPREALASATGNYARLFRDRGLIAPGRRADLLLLRADPRHDVAAIDHIAITMAGGRPIDPAKIASPPAP